MTRPLRIEFPGALYWVSGRALPRQRLVRDPSEVEDFLARLPALAEGFGIVFHGFCVLPDHYHLLAETPQPNLSRVLHRLNAGYTATANARRKRRGPLLQSRYRAILLDQDPWLLRLSVHVHLNPVRKRLAPDPWSYPGSSARAFAPGGAPVPGLRTSKVLGLAGGREPYARLVEEALSRPPAAPWKEVWRQTVLGGEALRQRVIAGIEGKDLREFAEFSDVPSGLGLDELLSVVAEQTGLRPEDLLRGKFQRVLARKAALYLARRFTGLTLREIGEAFGVDYTTVHMAARRVEELRTKDGAVDEFLSGIEEELRARGHGPKHGEPEPPENKRQRKKPSGGQEKRSAQLKLF
jgi:putative transposase